MQEKGTNVIKLVILSESVHILTKVVGHLGLVALDRWPLNYWLSAVYQPIIAVIIRIIIIFAIKIVVIENK